jgi:uncharacterized Fe-S cluster-containing MiaB family protein
MKGENAAFLTICVIFLLIVFLVAAFFIGKETGEDRIARQWCIEKGFTNGEFLASEHTVNCYSLDFDINRYREHFGE